MEIIDDGETVVFDSLPHLFDNEKSGRKPNTIRFFRSDDDETRFISSLFSLSKIVIRKSSDKSASFQRIITDISVLSLPLLISGDALVRAYNITWEHRQDSFKGACGDD
jgi:hypothetical protein